MTNKQIVIAIVILIIGCIAVYLMWYRKPSIEEGFWNIPSRSWKVERVFQDPAKSYNGSPDFYQTPHFQGILSPRFSNVDYGPNLRTQLPGYLTSGVPADPLGGAVGGSFYAADSGKVQQIPTTAPPSVESFSASPQGDCGYASYNTPYDLQFQSERVLADPHNPSSYTNGNYKQVLGSGLSACDVSDVPTTAAGSYLTLDGELKQPIIYDRYMYANRHSRLRAHGDPIRGDLPIVPASGNWFTPNVHPNIDLQAGAINVLAGVNNETSHQLANLIYNSSGGGDTTIGGVDMTRMNMSNQIFGATAAARGDVIMTSFP